MIFSPRGGGSRGPRPGNFIFNSNNCFDGCHKKYGTGIVMSNSLYVDIVGLCVVLEPIKVNQ